MEHDQAIAVQLRARGVQPADVAVVVMTHLHWDHASARVRVPRRDVRRRPPRVGRRDRAPAAPRAVSRPTSSTTRSTGARSTTRTRASTPSRPSARSVDLFGDGSVRLRVHARATRSATSRCSLRLEGREALLCGDAAYTLQHDRTATPRPLLTADEHLFGRSLKEIGRFVERTPGLVVIPGHDREAWPKLERVY